MRRFSQSGRGWCAVWPVLCLLAGVAARADVAVPFRDYTEKRNAAGVLHEPRWREVAARPDSYRGFTLSWFVLVQGRIDSDADTKLIARSRAGESLLIVCPSGCRVGLPGDWLGVLGKLADGPAPDAVVASMVTRIAAPASPTPPPAPQPSAAAPAAAPTPGGTIAPENAGEVKPADGGGAPVTGGAPGAVNGGAAGGAFAPPYEMVRPQDLAHLERFIVDHNRRLRDDYRRFIGAEIIRISTAYRMRWEFLAAVVRAESDFDPLCRSGAGAMGLGQLMPGTAAELGVSNPWDIRQNLTGAAAYLRRHLDRWADREPVTQFSYTLAAYNAGPNAVTRAGGVPPIAETQNYIRKIMGDYVRLCNETAAGR